MIGHRLALSFQQFLDVRDDELCFVGVGKPSGRKHHSYRCTTLANHVFVHLQSGETHPVGDSRT